MTFDLFAPPRRRFTKAFLPNPFYPGTGTVVVTDTTTGRWRAFPIWADTTRGDARRLAWHHVRALRLPIPADNTPRAPAFKFSRARGSDFDSWTE